MSINILTYIFNKLKTIRAKILFSRPWHRKDVDTDLCWKDSARWLNIVWLIIRTVRQCTTNTWTIGSTWPNLENGYRNPWKSCSPQNFGWVGKINIDACLTLPYLKNDENCSKWASGWTTTMSVRRESTTTVLRFRRNWEKRNPWTLLAWTYAPWTTYLAQCWTIRSLEPNPISI